MQATRRHLLTGSFAAAGLASGWVSRAFAAGRQDPARTDLKVALAIAKRRGKALLILVIPEGSSDRHRWGSVWGSVLNHGSKQVRSTLALCDLVCASMTSIRRAFGEDLERTESPLPTGVPIALLLETDILSSRAIAVPAEVQDPAHDPYGQSALAKSRMDALGTALLGAVLPEEISLRTRAAQEKAARLVDIGSLADADQARLTPAAALYTAATLGEQELLAAQARVAQAFQKRMEDHIPGAEWGRSTGCGTHIEGREHKVMVACGMGHTPLLSQRFLSFYGG